MKKSNRWIVFWSLLGLAAWCGVIWVALAPQPPSYHPSSVLVHVKPFQAPAEAPAEPTAEETGSVSPPTADHVMPESDQQVALAEVKPAVLPPPHKLAPGKAPKIAIVIDDMGLYLKGSERATRLPPAITLSYMPYAERLSEQTGEARHDGHELLLHMPMEPVGHDDPGPGALLTSLSPDEIRARFVKALDSFDSFDGVNNHMGSKFTADTAGMEIVVDELQKRHLFFLDSRTSPKTVGYTIAKEHGLPTLGRDVFLDDELKPDTIRTQLERTESVAKRQGYAIAIGHPHDVTLDVLEQWIPEAEKRGFVFVPLHDLLKGQVTPAAAH